MKKIFISLIVYLIFLGNLSAEIKRIISGNFDAKITMIIYESLTCSHCADFHKNIYPQLKKDYIDTGIVKLEFRHFPLDMAALNASKISQCTQDQGLEILDSLYSNQKDWIKGNTVEDLNSNLKKFIQNKGFNLDIDNCLSNKEIEDFVLNDRIEGTKNFEINSTPTVIINNEKFKKTLNYKNLKKSIEKLI
tara:strand:+ start:468 stop:1043 length:576 start_codon:yes stop_codon:yes gene_type:complete